MNTFVLPDGRQLHVLTEETYKLTDMGSVILHYGRIEHVSYAPSLGEQYLQQRAQA